MSVLGKALGVGASFTEVANSSLVLLVFDIEVANSSLVLLVLVFEFCDVMRSE
jgi:hypothetical protein